MRILTRLVTGAAVAAAAVAMAAVPALADPPTGVSPRAVDVVGVGSDTIQNVLDQFSHDYNATHAGTKLYSWDATNPKTGAIADNILLKRGCTVVKRPNGSSAGVTALGANLGGSTAGHPCVDFARSSRDRSATDPPFAPGGIAFVTLAGDAVTYSTHAVTNAPANLTTADLTLIYECRVTNWRQVGGRNAPIKPFIPQTGSGTRSFFLKAIGVTSPGTCVSDVPTTAVPSGTLEENEGVNPALNGRNRADVIFPYSIGKWIAQAAHSAKCLNTGCTPVGGVVCRPGRGQNLFGCDVHGTMVLRSINRTAPTVGTGRSIKINPGFTSAFVRTLFEVVRYTVGTRDHIPAYLEPFFGARGYVCSTAAAKADLLNYGFIVLPTCGKTH
jgi:ABC-type phosphate transport system substrate-binding protein